VCCQPTRHTNQKFSLEKVAVEF